MNKEVIETNYDVHIVLLYFLMIGNIIVNWSLAKMIERNAEKEIKDFMSIATLSHEIAEEQTRVIAHVKEMIRASDDVIKASNEMVKLSERALEEREGVADDGK